jgi:dTDP-4-dehydrorhamnose reductase
MNRQHIKETNPSLIVVTGVNGFIGKQLLPHLQEYRCVGIDMKPTIPVGRYTFMKADLRKPDQVKDIFEKYTPDVVYHFAALISPEINEKNVEVAKESHVTITQNILDNLPNKTHLFFLSTDKVFDGSHPCPDEDAVTHPLWKYGEFKLLCEQMIREQKENVHILRLPIIHSFGNPDSSSFIDKALLQIKEQKPVQIYDNVFRCYVLVSDLVVILKKLLADTHYGVYHVGTEMMNYYDRVKQLCENQQIDYEHLLKPVHGSAQPMKQNLDTKKIRSLLHYEFQ